MHWIRKVNVLSKMLLIEHHKDVQPLSLLIAYPQSSMHRKSLLSTKVPLLKKVNKKSTGETSHMMIVLGTHQSLMNARGVYYGLVEAQNLRKNNGDQKELEDEEQDDDLPGMIS